VNAPERRDDAPNLPPPPVNKRTSKISPDTLLVIAIVAFGLFVLWRLGIIS